MNKTTQLQSSLNSDNPLTVPTGANDNVPVLVAGENDDNRFLTFCLGDDVFGIQILSIKEIIEYTRISDVPMVPKYIRGIINLRGNVVPVIELAERLEIAVYDKTVEKSCIIIIEVKYENDIIDIGIFVDAVNKVYHIEPEQIDSALAFGSKVDAKYILGMGHVNGSITVLLAVDKILDIDDLAPWAST